MTTTVILFVIIITITHFEECIRNVSMERKKDEQRSRPDSLDAKVGIIYQGSPKALAVDKAVLGQVFLQAIKDL